MKLCAVCTGQPAPIDAKSGLSAIDKRARTGPVKVGPLGLAGDAVVDTAHHGGPDQAVLIGAETDRAWWSEHLGRPLPPGYFGENLLIDGLDSSGLAIGDRFVIGAVQIEVTSPRIPCASFAARAGSPEALRTYYASGRPGAYGRVLAGGTVSAGDPVRLIPAPAPRVGLTTVLGTSLRTSDDPDLLARILAIPAHGQMKVEARARLNALT